MAVQNIVLQGSIPERVQNNAAQRPLIKYIVPATHLRVWNSLVTSLPAAGAADDLGLVQGVFATGSPSIQTSDAKATTVAQKARFIWSIPPEYDPAQNINITLHGGMLTTVSDTSATADVEAYKMDKAAGIGSDLITTAATSINSVSLQDYSFTIDGSSLAVGDSLDIQITIAITDSATVTAVIGFIGEISMRMDIRMG